jgi:hypothetical protein
VKSGRTIVAKAAGGGINNDYLEIIEKELSECFT